MPTVVRTVASSSQSSSTDTAVSESQKAPAVFEPKGGEAWPSLRRFTEAPDGVGVVDAAVPPPEPCAALEVVLLCCPAAVASSGVVAAAATAGSIAVPISANAASMYCLPPPDLRACAKRTLVTLEWKV